MKRIEFSPKGVCSKKIIIEAEKDIITKVQIIGGCPGNTLGISKLCVGHTIDEIIKELKGVRCGLKQTSCPDQLSIALEELKKQ